MAAAHAARGLSGGVMVMLVQPGERNSYDQQARPRAAGHKRCALRPSAAGPLWAPESPNPSFSVLELFGDS